MNPEAPNRIAKTVHAPTHRTRSTERSSVRESRQVGITLYNVRGERKYLTAAERERFLETADQLPNQQDRAFCRTLALTGCRISEALGVTASSIIADESLIVLRTLKRRRGLVIFREVPVPESLIELLRCAYDLGDVRSVDDRLWPWSRTHAWQIVKAVMANAGIDPGLHAMPKGLRHGFGVHAIRSGVPESVLQRWMGHSRRESTAVYTQVTGREEREFAAKMWSEA